MKRIIWSRSRRSVGPDFHVGRVGGVRLFTVVFGLHGVHALKSTLPGLWNEAAPPVFDDVEAAKREAEKALEDFAAKLGVEFVEKCRDGERGIIQERVDELHWRVRTEQGALKDLPDHRLRSLALGEGDPVEIV